MLPMMTMKGCTTVQCTIMHCRLQRLRLAEQRCLTACCWKTSSTFAGALGDVDPACRKATRAALASGTVAQARHGRRTARQRGIAIPPTEKRTV